MLCMATPAVSMMTARVITTILRLRKAIHPAMWSGNRKGCHDNSQALKNNRAFRFSCFSCFAAYGGEVEREGARTPRAPAGGLAALLHLLPSEAFCVHGTSAICTSV